MTLPGISVIVTTYNEGQELRRTLTSVQRHTRRLAEIIVVDDGSTDGSCAGLDSDVIRVVRHQDRVGVAYSRDEGSRLAQGDVLCYLDAHQRVSRGCLDRCAALAIERDAITCPDIRNYGAFNWRLHGAEFRLCPRQGYFSASWRLGFAFRRVTQVSGLRAPPYLIPRSRYPLLSWSPSLRGWGASEASMVVKAFFTGAPIFHLSGPLARHRFQMVFPYSTTWDNVWRNQAIIARVCFDDRTWFDHWLPRVFDKHLSDEILALLESPEIQAEHQTFLASKQRTDRQFWTEMVREDPPVGV